uniref:Uncharacterized protein n=1 Tax=Manihot esculenta TaxID=3983 RepID=A0A2C9VJK8_MANES
MQKSRCIGDHRQSSLAPSKKRGPFPLPANRKPISLMLCGCEYFLFHLLNK